MDGHEDQEKLASFMSITGADTTSALRYMEMMNWEIESAVNMYLETKDDDRRSAKTLVHDSAPSASAAGSSGPLTRSHGTPTSQTDDVRAPDPFKRQRLVGGDRFSAGFDSSSFHRVATHHVHDAFRDFAAEAAALQAQERGGSLDSQGLSTLFQPPHGILFHGGFEEARQKAKQDKKWLLVNLQCRTEFSSHMLNRDTWSDDTVQNVVLSGFIFWQNYNNSEAGKRYCTLYHVTPDKLPCIAVIDPRTGEKLVEWKGFIDPIDLTERLSDFCELNALDNFSAKQKWHSEGGKPKHITERSEDEQLAAAIAASLGHVNGNMVDSAARSDSEVEIIPSFEATAAATPPPAPRRLPLPAEPKDGIADTTRVQIRTANGARLMRRFLKTDAVAHLFTFVAEEVPEARTREFQLRTVFPPSTIRDDDRTIHDAQLDNASIVMQWE